MGRDKLTTHEETDRRSFDEGTIAAQQLDETPLSVPVGLGLFRRLTLVDNGPIWSHDL
jgi:hypothetical protein